VLARAITVKDLLAPEAAVTAVGALLRWNPGLFLGFALTKKLA
jgi:hypothetical protein